MRGNPGILITLSDGRNCIVYNRQPLKEKGKIILHLLDENLKLITNESGKPKVVIKNEEVYKEEMKTAKLIGLVD